ncbi:hypothetical protein LSCM1_07546 [Leishmania martiniquensis]|uniref:Kinesin motor domain-containing protein n=1 Tax=Leishmania martiniquensis TaxID=1580590 RepID=A0A836HFY1_9TRYP|nr:hypothetical protein LSCM1_07546 [Leishmania martiniquensis]
MTAAATPAVIAAQQQQLYEVTCKSLLDPAPLPLEQQQRGCSRTPLPMAARRIYLAYGQTASGKTYSLFGGTSAWSGVKDLSPSAGVVPRYLHDVFSARPSAADDVFVDISAFEVYNEATTDLVALSVMLSSSGTSCPTTDTAAVGRRLRPNTSIDSGGGVAHSLRASDLRRQLPVCVAHHLYRSEQQLEDAGAYTHNNLSGTRSESSISELTGCTVSVGAAEIPLSSPPTLSQFLKTEYKATEKQQVLRALERARCTTFAEAQSVLQALLALRQERATGRNQSSSRGHLVLCVHVYAPAAGDSPAGEWIMQHETAFVDLAGSERGNLSEADVANVCNSTLMQHKTKRQGRAAATAASSSRAGSQHSRISLDVSLLSGTPSQHSAASHSSPRSSFSPTTTTASAYHRSLLRPTPEEDKKAALERRRRETRFINASLLALRKVFRALHEATRLNHTAVPRGPAATLPRRPPLHHAPFKDSALTAILEPFLVPQSATVHVALLLCCSSKSVDFFETVASLRLGAEATAVDPEVVLQALPVQQREQQQQLSARAAGLQSHRASASHRYRDGSACTARFSQQLFRSASAPSRRLAPGGNEYAQGKAEDFGEHTSALGISAAAQRHDGHRSDEVVMSATDAARLRGEARRYKETAQQLYEQCKSLCESYDECVDELRRCHVALAERDARIAALEAALEVTPECDADTSQQPHRPLQALMQSRTPKALRNGSMASGSPSVCAPHPLRRQRSGRKAAAEADYPGVISTADDGGMWTENTLPVPPATVSGAAAGMQATSTSPTAREGSGRWMVSVSPFSTASVAAGTAGQMAVVCEDAEGIRGVHGSIGSVGSDADDTTRWARTMHSRRSSSSGSSSGSGVRHPSSNASFERQQQRARCVMDTLLARQIFHSDAPAETTSSPSPPRASCPSPALPALSARGTAGTAGSLRQQQVRGHSCSQDGGSGMRGSQQREPHSGGGRLAREAATTVGEPPCVKEAVEKRPAAATSASLSAPRQSSNTARSSSAGATASSSVEGRGSVSPKRPSCDSIAEGPEAGFMSLPSPAVPAADGVAVPSASPTALSTTATQPTDWNSRAASQATLDDSPFPAASKQAIFMPTNCDSEAPHAGAVASGDEAGAVEEVVIQLQRQDRQEAFHIPATLCSQTETASHVQAKSRVALMPPCRSSSPAAALLVPATLPASALTHVYRL